MLYISLMLALHVPLPAFQQSARIAGTRAQHVQEECPQPERVLSREAEDDEDQKWDVAPFKSHPQPSSSDGDSESQQDPLNREGHPTHRPKRFKRSTARDDEETVGPLNITSPPFLTSCPLSPVSCSAIQCLLLLKTSLPVSTTQRSKGCDAKKGNDTVSAMER